MADWQDRFAKWAHSGRLTGFTARPAGLTRDSVARSDCRSGFIPDRFSPPGCHALRHSGSNSVPEGLRLGGQSRPPGWRPYGPEAGSERPEASGSGVKPDLHGRSLLSLSLSGSVISVILTSTAVGAPRRHSVGRQNAPVQHANSGMSKNRDTPIPTAKTVFAARASGRPFSATPA